MFSRFIIVALLIAAAYAASTGISSCAVMVPPTGGPRDSIAPQLLKAAPSANAVNVTSKTITLEFDEFVETDDVQNKIWITPAQERQPEVRSKLRTVTIKLFDSLQQNTTYKLTVNGAIKDVNEGNRLNDLDIVFSTGATIDSNSISGTVVNAEDGKVDSTLIVGLYTNISDSAVAKEKPKFIARLNSAGAFKFTNLPNKQFAIFVLPNEGGQRRYTAPSQPFAFSDSLINAGKNPSNIKLYTYVQETERPRLALERATADTKLRYGTNMEGGKHDVLAPIKILAARRLAAVDTNLITVTDTLGQKIVPIRFTLDSNKKEIDINAAAWSLDTKYWLWIKKDALKDEKGVTNTKTDTIQFTTKAAKDYGKLIIRFTTINIKANPVVLLYQSDKLVQALPVNNLKLTVPMLNPGEYQLRILYDKNKNQKWDAGNYFNGKKQPELVKPLDLKIAIKADWDNEVEILEEL